MDHTKVDIEPFKVNPKNFKKANKKVIPGGQGSVSFFIDSTTNKKVVLKQSNESLKNQAKILFYQEIETLVLAHHPAIVKFVGWAITSKNKGNIYLEEASKGSLDSMIKKSQAGEADPLWDDTHKLIISYGIAQAMRYLHSLTLLHRDLKCENVLLDDNLYPYVTDFGTSKTVDDVKTSQTVQQTTARIMPPEFLDDYQKYNRSLPIDVYSYAMVLFYLWTEKEPFEGLSNLAIIEKTIKQIRPEFPSNKPLSEKWKTLIERCWAQDFTQRPTFEEICNLLESPEFLTSEIDKGLFNEYKAKLEKEAGTTPTPPPAAAATATANSASADPVLNLKKSADDGNVEAQLEYALRLYNGLGVEKNQDEASHYFELSANGGQSDAQLYYSLILARKGDIQRSADYFSKSMSACNAEAYANYARQLIDNGNTEQSLQCLHDSLRRGSLSATLAFANIHDNETTGGISQVFYEIAANKCHCLDSVGSYFPIDFKVFKCNDCNLEICEGCAKFCHKGHSVVEIGEKNAFVCGCGSNHFVDKKKKKSCSFEFVGESLCNGEPVCYQHFYRCNDCSSGDQSKLICRSCAENCHKGHDVVDCGVKKGFCSCGAKKLSSESKCKLSYFREAKPDACTCMESKSVQLQRWFQCMSCGLYASNEQGVCINCAKNCHADHFLIDRGVRQGKCQCENCTFK